MSQFRDFLARSKKSLYERGVSEGRGVMLHIWDLIEEQIDVFVFESHVI